jgi:hypothetical protein
MMNLNKISSLFFIIGVFLTPVVAADFFDSSKTMIIQGASNGGNASPWEWDGSYWAINNFTRFNEEAYFPAGISVETITQFNDRVDIDCYGGTCLESDGSIEVDGQVYGINGLRSGDDIRVEGFRDLDNGTHTRTFSSIIAGSSGGGGNPFNQSLNTTDEVRFLQVNSTDAFFKDSITLGNDTRTTGSPFTIQGNYTGSILTGTMDFDPKFYGSGVYAVALGRPSAYTSANELVMFHLQFLCLSFGYQMIFCIS